MRSANRIGSTVSEWQELQRTERAATLKALLAQLREARESGAEWYRWIADGRPALTEAEYAAVGKFSKAKRPARRV